VKGPRAATAGEVEKGRSQRRLYIISGARLRRAGTVHIPLVLSKQPRVEEIPRSHSFGTGLTLIGADSSLASVLCARKGIDKTFH